MLDHLRERLTEEGIGYENVVREIDGKEFVYIHHGAFGYPKGIKIKRNEFRPDFRVSYDGLGYYTKVCGYTSWMNLEEIVRTAKEWGK